MQRKLFESYCIHWSTNFHSLSLYEIAKTRQRFALKNKFISLDILQYTLPSSHSCVVDTCVSNPL